MEKKPWESKTIWVNAVIAAGVAGAQVLGQAIPVEIVAIATPVINMLLRLMTNRKISL